MSSVGGHSVKVKVVVTRYVQTDAAQFKSIVQNLTGKDAVVGGAGGADVETPAVAVRKPPGLPPTGGAAKGGRRSPCGGPPAAPPDCLWRELEGLFMELPLLDHELRDTWRND